MDASPLYVADRGVFAPWTGDPFDSFRPDLQGRLWTSNADGVHDPDGTLIGKIRIRAVSNLTFGGAKRNRLFITATSSLYAVYLKANGASAG